MEEDAQTYYEVLEVPESASPEEIRSAYRNLAQEYHPDKLHHLPEHLRKLRKDAEEKFKEVDEAWKVLGNAAQRKQYDGALKEQRER